MPYAIGHFVAAITETQVLLGDSFGDKTGVLDVCTHVLQEASTDPCAINPQLGSVADDPFHAIYTRRAAVMQHVLPLLAEHAAIGRPS